MERGPQLRALRYSLSGERINPACSLKISGDYEEVLDEAIAHARRVHHASGDDAELREAVRASIVQDAIEWLWPGSDGDEGRETATGWPDEPAAEA